MDRYKNKRIYLLGDSISSTDYPWYREALMRLTGAADVYNAGFSGRNTAFIACDGAFKRLEDYDPDLVIALVAGNDAAEKGTVGTFSADSPNGRLGEEVVSEVDVNTDFGTLPEGQPLILAIAHIIRRFNEMYYDFKKRAGVTGDISIDDPVSCRKLDLVRKPRLVFCTSLPQKRNNDDDSFSDPMGWERRRNAVIECCERYNVPCLDLYSKVRWDWSKEPYWVPPTSTKLNRGIYTMDGLHPNKYGYEYIAGIVAGFIETI